jgi:hypothetical protein
MRCTIGIMARMQKLSISLPPSLAEQVREAAAQVGLSMSAWLAGAAEEELRHQAKLAALAEYETKHGRITAEEAAATDSMIVVVGAIEPERGCSPTVALADVVQG